VHPILINRPELKEEGLVKPLYDLWFAFHDVLQFSVS
jgi:hypothetical protein